MSALPAPTIVDDHISNIRDRVERLDQNILYAQKLQDALYRTNARLELFEDQFIIDRPKDSVGGDFYMIDKITGRKMILVGDCTGHGPSGAMLSALCVSILKELFAKYKALSPGLIISKALSKLEDMLGGEEDFMRDGMEVTLLFINEGKQEVKFATTGQYLFIYGPDGAQVIKTRHIGYERAQFELIDQEFSYEKGSMIYIPTDGMKDQFGSESGRKFSIKRMTDCFNECWAMNCSSQQELIASRFDHWQGSLEDQTDDVLLIGVRI